jgi:hypothetical protein
MNTNDWRDGTHTKINLIYHFRLLSRAGTFSYPDSNNFPMPCNFPANVLPSTISAITQLST